MKNGPVIRIGVSACLMGRACRYNGTAKRCDWASVGTEDAGVVWLPFCPEQAAGLGTPRPPIELVGRDAVFHSLYVAQVAKRTVHRRLRVRYLLHAAFVFAHKCKPPPNLPKGRGRETFGFYYKPPPNLPKGRGRDAFG